MWISTNVAIQGSSHIKSCTPCQDYVDSVITEKGGAIVLSDGAGSAKYSNVGSEISCSALFDYISERFDELYNGNAHEIKLNIIHRIRTRLGIAAKNRSTKKDDFASTLLFVAIENDKFVCGHLGDGVIGYITLDNSVEVLSKPENGEFANTTFFTVSKNYQRHLRLIKGSTKEVKAFFLMSDGAAECLYQRKSNQFANAINMFSNWIDLYDITEVKKAIKENLERLFPLQTTDDCSFNIIQRKENLSKNSQGKNIQ